jgi:hypothetical protein
MASVPLSPLLIAGSAVPGWNVPHLPHLLPRFASRGVVSGLAFRLPFVWTYERVAGATVRGRAGPGVRVVAELPFTEHGRPHTYKAWTDAGADGRWELVLPFPSGYRAPTVASAAAWTARAGGGPAATFVVPEEAVRAGAAVDVGALLPRVDDEHARDVVGAR